MSLFHVIDDAFAILLTNGVYRQAKVYHKDGRLFAAHGSGFVGLFENGTTVPRLNVDALVLGFTPAKCPMGRLYKPGTPTMLKRGSG